MLAQDEWSKEKKVKKFSITRLAEFAFQNGNFENPEVY